MSAFYETYFLSLPKVWPANRTVSSRPGAYFEDYWAQTDGRIGFIPTSRTEGLVFYGADPFPATVVEHGWVVGMQITHVDLQFVLDEPTLMALYVSGVVPSGSGGVTLDGKNGSNSTNGSSIAEKLWEAGPHSVRLNFEQQPNGCLRQVRFNRKFVEGAGLLTVTNVSVGTATPQAPGDFWTGFVRSVEEP